MLRKLLALTTAIPVITACAAFQALAMPQVTPQQTALIQATCTTVDRLHQGQAQWDGCVASLSETAMHENRDSQLDQAYRACAKDGLKANTAELSTCVLDRKNAAASRSVIAADIAYVKPADSDPSSYFSASFDTRRHREEYSCALMGLQPGSGSFGSCVANLDSTLFNIGNPNG
jgi:hypothetical protein